MKTACNCIFALKKRDYKGNLLWISLIVSLSFVSCKSSKNYQDSYINSLVKAAVILGIDIEEHDDHPLFLESAKWIGVPYKYGGSNTNGTDCSGLSYTIYDNVYNIRIPRTSSLQHKESNRNHTNRIKQGDLLFFTSPNADKNTCSHVGIYLKNGKFLHSGTTRGVIVSDLSENYWRKHWLCSGRFQP